MTNRNNSQEQQDHQKKDGPDREDKLTFLQMIGSSLAAAFGVQSQRNKERDFEQGNIKRFIITGVVLTGLFLLTMMGIVKLVLSL